jgi:hypothetical protein
VAAIFYAICSINYKRIFLEIKSKKKVELYLSTVMIEICAEICVPDYLAIVPFLDVEV